jgi:hypothetical protein
MFLLIPHRRFRVKHSKYANESNILDQSSAAMRAIADHLVVNLPKGLVHFSKTEAAAQFRAQKLTLFPRVRSDASPRDLTRAYSATCHDMNQ